MVFQIIAAVLLVIFYGCYFLKMIKQRRKGIQTDQIGKGKEGLVKYIETAMRIATYIVPVAEVVSILQKWTVFPTAVRMIGCCVGTAGTAIFVISVLTMKDSWRAGVSRTDETALVTEGIYQISRNPAFLGFDLVYIGILMMFFNRLLFIASVFAILMFHLQIVNVEEDFLLERFGDEYLSYKKKVCRYIGRK